MAILKFNTQGAATTYSYDERLELFLSSRSPATAVFYRGLLARFEGFTKKHLIDTTADDVQRFATWWISERGHKSRVYGDAEHSKVARHTVAGGLKRLSFFWEYLKSRGIVQGNPFLQTIELLGKTKPGEKIVFTQAVGQAEVLKLLNACNIYDKKGLRDAALIHMLFGGGFRISEVLNMRLCDITIGADGNMRFRLNQTKTSKIPVFQEISPELTDIPLKYLEQRKAEALRFDAYFLVAYIGGAAKESKMGVFSGRAIFNRVARSVGLPETITPHSARATAITRLLDLGISHRDIQKFSRHSSIHSVEHYDAARFSDADSVAKKLTYK